MKKFTDFYEKKKINEAGLFNDIDSIRNLPSRPVTMKAYGPAKMEFQAPPPAVPPTDNTFTPPPQDNKEAPLPQGPNPDENKDENKDDTSIQDNEMEKQDEQKTESRLKEIRDKVVEKFNTENEQKSRIVLKAYEPFSTYIRSFKVTYLVDEEEPYLDKEAYATGKSKPELNESFFKEIRAIAKEFDVDDVEWKSDDEAYFGTLVID